MTVSQQDMGRFIATKRREKNLTQEQLAERLGVSNKTVSKWENGKSMPDYSVVELLCKELDITVSELLAGKEKESACEAAVSEEQVALLTYQTRQMENQKKLQLDKPVKTGVTLGSVLAMIISYTSWHSIGWAILHGFMSWGYVIYYWIRY